MISINLQSFQIRVSLLVFDEQLLFLAYFLQSMLQILGLSVFEDLLAKSTFSFLILEMIFAAIWSVFDTCEAGHGQIRRRINITPPPPDKYYPSAPT